MTNPTDPSGVPDSKAVGTVQGGAAMSRRKLLKLGVGGGSALLVSLASRSVFACHSTTPSAFGSINLSRPDVLVPLSGRSPGYWKTHTGYNDWPAPYYPTRTRYHRATTFVAAFGVDSFPGMTLLQVLGQVGGGKNAVGRAIVAALLNAASGRTHVVLPVSKVKEMWSQYASTGYGQYEPTPGVIWYSDTPLVAGMIGSGGIIGYLNTTWT